MSKNKDANLDIEAPKIVETEFPHEHATVSNKTGRLNKCPEKGKPDKNSYLVNIEKYYPVTFEGSPPKKEFFIKITQELLEQLDWKENNKLCLSTTLNCFDWGKVDSIVLRNLSKEIDE